MHKSMVHCMNYTKAYYQVYSIVVVFSPWVGIFLTLSPSRSPPPLVAIIVRRRRMLIMIIMTIYIYIYIQRERETCRCHTPLSPEAIGIGKASEAARLKKGKMSTQDA